MVEAELLRETFTDTVEAKLSRETFTIYTIYKKATSKVVNWLTTKSEITSSNGEEPSLPELERAAEVVKKRQISVPDEIDYAFQDAIHARTWITSHFQVQ